jgi:hypothetical protein
LQVVPASHVLPASGLWHAYLHAVPPSPQLIWHEAATSEQSAVQPFGQSIAHEVLPSHVTVDPAPTLVLASDLPLSVTLLSAPASMMQVDPPAHVAVQSAPHIVPHVDWAAQAVVHPVPHVVVHVLVWQSNVTLLGGAASPPSLPPRTQLPPVHVHVPPSHMQPVPEQVAMPASLPASPAASGPASIIGGGVVPVVVGVGAGAASMPESPVSTTASLLSLPQPIAIAAPRSAAEPAKYAT